MSSTLSDIGLCDVANGGLYSIEGREFLPATEDFGPEFKKYLKKTPKFCRIWHGGPEEIHIRLKKQVDVDAQGRLLYNGKLYNKDSWCCYFNGACAIYGPPKFIRMQGRMAKEYADPRNNTPTDVIELPDGKKQRVRRACSICGGQLIYDRNMVLYCADCMIIEE